MEGNGSFRYGRGRHRRRKRETNITSNTLFPLLLAALSSTNSQFLIKKCLNKLRLFLHSQSHPTLPTPILSLLPLLLKSKCGAILRRSTEVVGAASLSSFENNERIALDTDIVKGLVLLLGNSNWRVRMAACNAVLDLSTTSIGRQRLVELSALDTLLFEFLQVNKSSIMVFLCGEDGDLTSFRIGLKADEFPILHLDAAIILINTCNFDQLEKIPGMLSECTFVLLKELWIKVRNKMVCGDILRFTEEKNVHLSNITVNSLAESIFRLSINDNKLTTLSEYEMVKSSIFGSNEAAFENFMLNYWEVSPFIVRRLSNFFMEDLDIFSSYVQSLNSKESVHSFVSSILQCMVSCPPIMSDEFDILSSLREVRNKIGCPLIYEQDIRVLKTDKHTQREVHFFPGSLDSCDVKSPYFIFSDKISKCEESYKEGYTIALRGMGFRFGSVATIANGFASLFGQPSVGANLYVTPPNSQGLACHFDDHCVFVCQLLGSKQWKIYPRPNLQFPRLYQPCAMVTGVEVESSMSECKQYSLMEGDVLYIPRGFPHEACTDDIESTGSAGFSLHLTLGVEVEPPFEWEGFAHVALFSWNQAQKQHHDSVESLSGIFNLMSVNLLHIVISLIGDSDPTFQKACLVAAVSSPSGSNEWLYLNHKTIFSHLLDKISAESRFLDVLDTIEMDIRGKIDPFQRIRWLQSLDLKNKSVGGHDWNIPFTGFETMFPLYVQHKDVAEVAFMQVKSNFCREVLYEDVVDNYKMLLEKYKKSRKEYMNGMLALHCN